MTNAFPHLSGSIPGKPGAGREVYDQIPGAFDYTLWDEGARLTLLSVPWGVYEPGTMTDAPGFDTVEERDEWFEKWESNPRNATETHVLETRVRYQIKDYADVGFSFDKASRYNYLIVDYPGAPIPNADGGIRRWFFHITDIDYSAPSTTRLMLVPDWWTTCAPLMDVSNMILERGHAPVAAVSVTDYLADPLNNSEMLLAPDVDFGAPALVASSHDEVINDGTVYAVICLRGVPITGSFGGYIMPFSNSTMAQGVPGDYQFAVLASDLAGFLDAWQANAAQSMQALDALYLCGEKLLSFAGAAEVFGYAIKTGAAGGKREISVSLSADKFGFADDVKHLAKLYTYPYSRLEVADQAGNVTEIRVEELSGGTLEMECALNGAFPWLAAFANVANMGGAKRSISFNTTRAETFAGGGRWYAALASWGVPCYTVRQSAAQAYDYHTHYSRIQSANNAATAYANATASNATSQTNANNGADNITATNAVTVAMNNAILATTIAANNSGVAYSNTKLRTDVQYDIGSSNAAFDAEQAQLGVAATNNNSQAALGEIAGGITTVASALHGDIGGALSGIGNMVNTGVSWAATNASITVSQSNNVNVYNQSITSAYGKQDASLTFNNASTALNNTTTSANNTTRNDAATQSANLSSGLVKTNAANTRATADANAVRARDNSLTAIQNGINEASMGAPNAYGIAQNGDLSNVRPMMLQVNFVTENKAAIRQAATQFLRYGYVLGQAWTWRTWNEMPHFTYWQVSDVWATGVDSAPEEGQDAVRLMLHGGVTLWKDPSEIGKVGIYGNR